MSAVAEPDCCGKRQGRLCQGLRGQGTATQGSGRLNRARRATLAWHVSLGLVLHVGAGQQRAFQEFR